MAVYTPVAPDAAAALVSRLRLGTLTAFEPVAGGIENTNYFVDTTTGRWVLTLFERLTAAELPFYLHLMKHLAARGLPVPDPQPDEHGEILLELAGKPAAVANRLPGRHHRAPDVAHCAQLGDALARLHRAALDFPRHQANPRGLAWWSATGRAVAPHLDAPRRALLETELAFVEHAAGSAPWAALPRGPVHADLFRDNVMFQPDAGTGGDRLSGMVDFYFAGVDALLLDVAVCLNDWCIDLDTGRLDEARADALARAYAAQRPFTGTERRLMPAMLRAAALRFWLSRQADLLWPRAAAVLQPHDPDHFERVLRERIASPWHPEPL
jgi:homoserine kinase type II